MMDCSEITSVLRAFTARALENDEMERVEKHLGSCPNCRGYASAYRLGMELAPETVPPGLPAGTRDLLLAALTPPPPPETPADEDAASK